MREAIDRLWAEATAMPRRRARCGCSSGCSTRCSRAAAPSRARGAARRASSAAKAVYVHSHMDEETFDTERVGQCCDSNCYADGTTIPVCNYNVLYREKEQHFMLEPAAWNERAGGGGSCPLPAAHRDRA